MATDIMTRVFFVMVQSILLLVFESRLHLFQARWLSIIVGNALMFSLGVKANPLLTFALLWFVSGPCYRRLVKKHAFQIDQAFAEDITLDYYQHKPLSTQGKELFQK